ncbi:hypothetical protein AMJ87_04255 [candidate division WOR_3 bacterium SM23_60]|uniref:SGNH hydrolase-type esterase domain-containing protein n=1 Tax=candidate division WOR_3 bacterium SM23_60 TaxID=1703780 RepID=A0A0S8GHZ7_UNCW3|nr:MAG: hypothetical protein AMJ87_04255 [candidate division WOR_3 bacterium SM23_60]
MRKRGTSRTGTRPSNIFERNPRKTILLAVVLLILITDLVIGSVFIPRNFNVFRCPHHFYHHGLLPNKQCTGKWGNRIFYSVVTNSLGFRDEYIRNVPLKSNKRRIVLIGDSFVESLGLDYAKSFVSILNSRISKNKTEILNAAVVSYSPKLYYLKIKYLVENIGLRFDELFVFIDICDVFDEIFYEEFEPKEYNIIDDITYRVDKYLKNTSYIYYSLNRMFQKAPGKNEARVDGLEPSLAPTGNEHTAAVRKIDTHAVPYWTVDESSFKLCVEKGLPLARMNMSKLATLCKNNNVKMTLVVYSWPHQIFYNDCESIQVTFWQEFCRQNGIAFINLFPLFINGADPGAVVARYFIKNDVHWNSQGHIIVANALFTYMDH